MSEDASSLDSNESETEKFEILDVELQNIKEELNATEKDLNQIMITLEESDKIQHIHEIEQQLKNIKEANTLLNDEIEIKDEDLDYHKKQYYAKCDEFDKQKVDFEDLKAKHDLLQKDFENNSLELNVYKEMYKSANDKVTDEKQKVLNLMEHLQEREIKLKESTEEICFLNEELNKTESEIDSYKKMYEKDVNFEKLKKKCDINKNNEFETQLDKLYQEIDSLKDQVKKKELELEEYKNLYHSAIEEGKQQNDDIEQKYEEQLDMLQKEYKLVDEKLTNTEMELLRYKNSKGVGNGMNNQEDVVGFTHNLNDKSISEYVNFALTCLIFSYLISLFFK